MNRYPSLTPVPGALRAFTAWIVVSYLLFIHPPHIGLMSWSTSSSCRLIVMTVFVNRSYAAPPAMLPNWASPPFSGCVTTSIDPPYDTASFSAASRNASSASHGLPFRRAFVIGSIHTIRHPSLNRSSIHTNTSSSVRSLTAIYIVAENRRISSAYSFRTTRTSSMFSRIHFRLVNPDSPVFCARNRRT